MILNGFDLLSYFCLTCFETEVKCIAFGVSFSLLAAAQVWEQWVRRDQSMLQKNTAVQFKTCVSIAVHALWFRHSTPGPFRCVSGSVFSPRDGTPVQQISKHRLHWLPGVIERKASPVRSASACRCRNGHLCPSSPHQAKGAKKALCRRPLNSALNHTLGRILFWWGDRADRRCWPERKKKKTRQHSFPLFSPRETTGEIIHEDGGKFSRAIDALLRLPGTRSEGLCNTCRGTRPPLLLPPPPPPPLCTIAQSARVVPIGADWGAALSTLCILGLSDRSRLISRHVWFHNGIHVSNPQTQKPKVPLPGSITLGGKIDGHGLFFWPDWVIFHNELKDSMCAVLHQTPHPQNVWRASDQIHFGSTCFEPRCKGRRDDFLLSWVRAVTADPVAKPPQGSVPYAVLRKEQSAVGFAMSNVMILVSALHLLFAEALLQYCCCEGHWWCSFACKSHKMQNGWINELQAFKRSLVGNLTVSQVMPRGLLVIHVFFMASGEVRGVS